jgi:hypothetical protein
MALGCKPSALRSYGGSNPPLSTISLLSPGAIDLAHVAQSAERILGKDEVTSSILVVGSRSKGSSLAV